MVDGALRCEFGKRCTADDRDYSTTTMQTAKTKPKTHVSKWIEMGPFRKIRGAMLVGKRRYGSLPHKKTLLRPYHYLYMNISRRAYLLQLERM